MDVSMNAQGIQVERFVGRSIISSLHGCFSLGAFAGAAIGAGVAQLGAPPLVHFLGVSVFGLAALSWIRRWLIPDTKDPRKSEAAAAFALPPRSLWLLGALALCASVGEGAIADWGGLYLRDGLGTSSGVAALGFAAFSVAMLVGRFSGDALVRRFGAPRLVRAGGMLAAFGLGVALLLNQPGIMLLGFAAVGLGLSIVYPLVFSAAGNHPTVSRGTCGRERGHGGLRRVPGRPPDPRLARRTDIAAGDDGVYRPPRGPHGHTRERDAVGAGSNADGAMTPVYASGSRRGRIANCAGASTRPALV